MMRNKMNKNFDLKELENHILSRGHIDLVAEFTIRHIEEWNFYLESFDSFTDRMEDNFATLCRMEY